MNLVKLIMDQLTGDTVAKLSKLLGIEKEGTTSAIGAAIPSILAALGGMASSSDGAKRLANTLTKLDGTSAGDFANQLSADTQSLTQKGAGLFDSLLGEKTRSGLADVVGKFAGIGPTATKQLLTYLTPLILGKVATLWKGQGESVSGLMEMFAEQKGNIADAIPNGLSLDAVPGMRDLNQKFRATTDAVRDTTTAAAGNARRATAAAGTTSRSMATWLVPAALVALGGFLLWNYVKSRDDKPIAEVKESVEAPQTRVALKPPVSDPTTTPAVAQVSDRLTGVLKSMEETFAEIQNSGSAQQALPQLKELNTKIDDIKSSLTALPESAQTVIHRLVVDQLGTLKERATQALDLPDLSAEAKTLIGEIMRKLSAMVASPQNP